MYVLVERLATNKGLATNHTLEVHERPVDCLDVLAVDVVVVGLFDNLLARKVLYQVIRRVCDLLILERKLPILGILRVHVRQLLLDLCNCHTHRLLL